MDKTLTFWLAKTARPSQPCKPHLRRPLPSPPLSSGCHHATSSSSPHNLHRGTACAAGEAVSFPCAAASASTKVWVEEARSACPHQRTNCNTCAAPRTCNTNYALEGMLTQTNSRRGSAVGNCEGDTGPAFPDTKRASRDTRPPSGSSKPHHTTGRQPG